MAMSQAQQRVQKGDMIRLMDTDYSTEQREMTAAAIARLWPTGASVSDIAEEIGVSPSHVRTVLNDHFRVVEEGEDAKDQRVAGTRDTGGTSASDDAPRSVGDLRRKGTAEQLAQTAAGDRPAEERAAPPAELETYRAGFRDGFKLAAEMFASDTGEMPRLGE